MGDLRYFQTMVVDAPGDLPATAAAGQPALILSTGEELVFRFGSWTSAVLRKLQTAGGTPTITPNALVLGTGATATIEGNNIAGKITMKTGTLSLGTSGVAFTLKLADGAAFPNRMHVNFSAMNDNFASILTNFYMSATSPDTATFSLGTVTLNISTSYMLNYQISGD